MLARRSFITGLVSLMAAPAIVRAGSLMQVKATEIIKPPAVDYSTLHQYDEVFASQGLKIGDTIHIRLPLDFTVSDEPWSLPLPVDRYQTLMVTATLESGSKTREISQFRG